MDNKPAGISQTSLELKKYIFKGLGYWYLFVIAIIVAFVYVKIQNRFVYQTYGVYTTVLVKGQGSNPENFAGGLQLFSSRNNLSNDIGFLKSFQIHEKVFNELNFDIVYYKDLKFKTDIELYKNAPFIVNVDTLFPQYNEIKVKINILDENKYQLEIDEFDIAKKLNFGEQFVYQNFNFNLQKDSIYFNKNVIGNNYFFYKRSKSSFVSEYASKLTAELWEGSTILWIWTTGTNPLKEIDYLNKIVEIYSRIGLREKNEIALNTIKFIDFQLNSFKDSLQTSENKLLYFKQNNSINISAQGENLLQQILEFDTERKQFQLKLTYFKYLLDDIKNNTESQMLMSPGVMGVNDDFLNDYLKKYSDAMYERKVLKFTVKDEADIPPNTISNLEIENIKKTITQHIEQTIKYTNKNIDEINKKRNELNKEISQLPFAEQQMMNITREFELNNEIYTLLLQRRIEAAITLASNTPNIRIIDKAKNATISSKGKKGGADLPKSLLIAFVIPILFIVIIEIFKNKIIDKSDVEKLTDISIIGSISHNSKKIDIPVAEHPKASISESFRSLRTNLQYLLIEKETNVIAVTSTISGEGKTFIAVNLASIIAANNKKTLLIALDLRKPKVHRNFNLSNDKGVSSYLVGEHTYDEIIQKTEINNLDIALSGEIPPNPAELIESNKMSQFLDRVKKEYDFVLIDTPPVAIVTDALLLAQKADAFIYVIRQNYSTRNSVKMLDEICKNNNIENISIVINDVNTSLGYGFKYGYGYGQGYGYGYGYGYGQGYYDDDKIPTGFFGKIKFKIQKFLLKIFS